MWYVRCALCAHVCMCVVCLNAELFACVVCACACCVCSMCLIAFNSNFGCGLVLFETIKTFHTTHSDALTHAQRRRHIHAQHTHDNTHSTTHALKLKRAHSTASKRTHTHMYTHTCTISDKTKETGSANAGVDVSDVSMFFNAFPSPQNNVNETRSSNAGLVFI